MKMSSKLLSLGLATVVLSACGVSGEQSELNEKTKKGKSTNLVKENTLIMSAAVSGGDVSLGKPIFNLSANVFVASSKCARAKVENTKFVQTYNDGVLEISVEQTLNNARRRPCVDNRLPVFQDMKLSVSVDLQQAYKVVLKNYQQLGKDFVIFEPTKAKLVSQEIWRDTPPLIEAVMKAQVAPFKNECDEKSVVHASLVYFTSQKPTEVLPTATAFAVLFRTPVIDGETCDAKKKPSAKAPEVFRAIPFTADELGKIMFKPEFSKPEALAVYPETKK